MHILITTDRYYPIGGGIQQYVRGLAKTLVKQGHKITFLVGAIEGEPEREQWQEGTIIRTPVYNDTLPKPEVMLERWQQLIPYIEQIQPDIIYTNNHTSVGTIQAAQAVGIPVVYGCHGWGLFCALKLRLLKPDDSLCYNDRSLKNCLACHDLMYPPHPPKIQGKGRWLIKTTYSRLKWHLQRADTIKPRVERYDTFQEILESADARIGVSHLTASMFRTREQTYGIHLGLDLEVFKPVDSTVIREEFGIGNAPYVSLVGRIHATKGHEWAVRALQYLPDDYKLVLVGPAGMDIRRDNTQEIGNNPHSEAVHKVIEELGFRDRVIFTGVLFPEKLRQIYSGAVANLMPSVWLEAFGYVTAEAMACGCPAIATTNSGSAELITDGVEGYKIPRMNAKAIANAILKIEPQRDTIGQAARSKAETALNWETISTQVMDVFNQVLIEKSSV